MSFSRDKYTAGNRQHQQDERTECWEEVRSGLRHLHLRRDVTSLVEKAAALREHSMFVRRMHSMANALDGDGVQNASRTISTSTLNGLGFANGRIGIARTKQSIYPPGSGAGFGGMGGGMMGGGGMVEDAGMDGGSMGDGGMDAASMGAGSYGGGGYGAIGGGVGGGGYGRGGYNGMDGSMCGGGRSEEDVCLHTKSAVRNAKNEDAANFVEAHPQFHSEPQTVNVDVVAFSQLQQRVEQLMREQAEAIGKQKETDKTMAELRAALEAATPGAESEGALDADDEDANEFAPPHSIHAFCTEQVMAPIEMSWASATALVQIIAISLCQYSIWHRTRAWNTNLWF